MPVSVARGNFPRVSNLRHSNIYDSCYLGDVLHEAGNVRGSELLLSSQHMAALIDHLRGNRRLPGKQRAGNSALAFVIAKRIEHHVAIQKRRHFRS